jgi:hypothetical protein
MTLNHLVEGSNPRGSAMWSGFFSGGVQLEVWDNRPGGKVVKEFTDPFTAEKYVFVEFEKTPGVQYKFIAPEA